MAPAGDRIRPLASKLSTQGCRERGRRRTSSFMRCRRFGFTSLSFLLAVTACTTNAGQLPMAPELITLAEQQLNSQSYDDVIATLAPLADLDCPKRLRDRRDLLIAKAELGRGDPWRAFEAIREFSVLYPHSDLRSQTVDVMWNAGKQLCASDAGFLFFWSDKRSGQTVLEHLITRNPDTQRLADALRILGDMAFDDRDYELAQERFRDIIFSRPDSDWRFYAQFRFAMSIVASLRGPDYDLYQMEIAVRELRDFLNNKPESPQMIAETEKALVKVLSWQIQRHLDIADFYNTLKNLDGERYHLQLATRREFQNTPGYKKAMARRTAFDAANPATTTSGGRP
jgi:outer membrane protein assembly factor BamD (BamD/ComL family)